jgi:uroporphyrinogen decarboxylase
MIPATMTSAQRLGSALGHQEGDRVPFLLPAVLHGARELGLSIKEYFSRAEYVAEGQLRIREKYRHDAVVGFMYGAVDAEAWGCEVIFRDDGPPNSGEPICKTPEQIRQLIPPKIEDATCLQRVLELIRILKARVGDDAPVMGCVISPFSLPVMQLGFDHYLDLIYDQPALFTRLMQLNEEFCVSWANAQIAAGAGVIYYFDPVSSPTIIPREKYLQTGFPIAKRVIPRIHGGVAIGFASGLGLPILDLVMQTGAVGVSASAMEDLAAVKDACRGRLAVMGNLNAIEMRRWTPAQAETEVKTAIAKAGRGGGFILTDNHGEIPWQVSDDILLAISDAVHTWGHYPLKWIEDDGE